MKINLSWTRLYRWYRIRISSRKYLKGTCIYSWSFTGDWRNMPFKSIEQNLAPFFASEIILLNKRFVSSMFAAGAPESNSYSNLSPPMTILILYFLFFNGQCSYANDLYVTFLLVGKDLWLTNSMLSVKSTPASLPVANRAHSLLRAGFHCEGPSSLASSLSRLFFFPAALKMWDVTNMQEVFEENKCCAYKKSAAFFF